MRTMLTEVFPRIVLVGLLAAALPACGALYLAQAARGQWQVMRERQPIDKVIADEHTSAALRVTLSELREARDFASRELGLPDNASYRSYADVGRPFVVWNVVAAPVFSITPKQWCFPIAGCVAYRGYFSEQQARDFARSLRTRGFDVTVDGVAAYSTLGKVADPVLNTMVGYGNEELVAIIFHELSHQVMYVAGDSTFNEAFAVTVERAGLERWLKRQGRHSPLQRFQAQQRSQLKYTSLFMQRRAELARLYKLKLAPTAMRERKQAILDALADDLRGLERQQGRPSPYSAWINEGLNNAHLASVATYFDCVPGFERLLAAQGGDLPAFYQAARELAGKPRAERHTQLCGGAEARAF